MTSSTLVVFVVSSVLAQISCKMEFYMKVTFETIAINIFFKKSFQLKSHAKLIIIALVISEFLVNFTYPGMLLCPNSEYPDDIFSGFFSLF